MHALDQLLERIRLQATVFHNGQYCGNWAIDTSGKRQINFHVVSRGTCYVDIDDQQIKLEQGDAIFFPKDAKHSLRDDANSEAELNQQHSTPMSSELAPNATGLVCGNFLNDHPLFNKLIEPLPDYIVVRANRRTPCSTITQLICEESSRTDSNTSLLLNQLSDCLFHYLLRNNLSANDGVFAASVHPKLSKAMQAIHDDTAAKHTVESLANTAAMSRSSFANLFKLVTQMSPMDYLTQWRMLCAYRWLADEQMSTFEVATRCGYETEASFSKAFSRVVGCGPGQVRAGNHCGQAIRA